MKRHKIKIGRVFTRLKVLMETETTYKRQFKCLCSCGEIRFVALGDLLSGKTKSCGCLTRDSIGERSSTHRKSHTKIYMIWTSMKARCLNPKNKSYKNYGDRGISVCESWINSFECFEKDMGQRPSPTHSIERIDNNLGYCKKNCKWATPKEQMNNIRKNVFLTYNGKTLSAFEWSKITGFSTDIIRRRKKLGWSDEKTLSKAVRFHPNQALRDKSDTQTGMLHAVRALQRMTQKNLA